MVTLLGTIFSTNEKIVSQCNNQTLKSTAVVVIIEFDQEKFEQHLSQGSKSPLSVHKHRKDFLKSTFVEAKQAQHEPKPVSIRAKQVPYEPKLASGKAKQAQC